MQSVLKIGFALAERVGQGEGFVHRFGRQCMAAVAGGYRKGLVSAEWPVLLLSCMKECGKWSFHLVSFQSGGAFLGRRALTIEFLVMSGCGQSPEPSKKPLK